MATVGDIFRAAFPGFAAVHGVRLAAVRAAEAIMSCRTAALGGHAEKCPDGHYVQSHYNSCKHRACPQCRGLEMARWLRRQVSRYALRCDYHHVVFTVPQDLNRVWQYNRSLFSNLMLQAGRDALMTLLKEAKYLGALPGVVGTVHTWGRSLIEHPHGHFLSTAGGWTSEGWKSCREDFFVPYKPLRELFRGKLLSFLRRELERGKLKIPEGMDRTGLLNEWNRLGRVDWHVKVMDRYEGGEGVLKYFSRYVRGGPISNSQILSYDGDEVAFQYRSHETGELTPTKLPVWEFIRRILEHVPEKGFRVVRYYGLFAPGHRQRLAACRSWLGMGPYVKPEKLTLEMYLEERQIEPLTRCPVCQKRLVREAIPRTPLPTAHSPPPEEGYRAAA